MQSMIKNNLIPFRIRIKELFIDWLFISIYLVILLAVMMSFYILVLGSIPALPELHSQLISVFTSVIPVILLFSYLDLKGGSIGKRKAGLTICFTRKDAISSLIRNIVKFVPWQIGHIAVIHGMYTEFDMLSVILTIVSCVLLVVMFLMGTMRRDKRHFGDMLAGTQVRLRK